MLRAGAVRTSCRDGRRPTWWSIFPVRRPGSGAHVRYASSVRVPTASGAAQSLTVRDQEPRVRTMQIEVSIKGLMVDPITNMAIVVLRDKEGQKVLPIWVGIFEADAIALQIENISTRSEEHTSELQ